MLDGSRETCYRFCMLQNIPNVAVCRKAVEGKLKECIEIIQRKLNITVPMPEVDYMGVTGRVGAKAIGTSNKILINMGLMVNNLDEYVRTTIPHEFAHLVTRRIYGYSGIQSHGAEWARIMNILGLPATRCHSYDVSVVTETFSYECNCKTHKVSKTLHNKMLRGKTYTCRGCRGALKKVEIPLPIRLGSR